MSVGPDETVRTLPPRVGEGGMSESGRVVKCPRCGKEMHLIVVSL